MTWLVLASDFDAAGRWIADGLADVDRGQVCFVTDADLAGAVWRHHLTDGRVHTRVDLVDGRVVDSAEIRATLNRLAYVPSSLVDGLVADDRLYGLQELSALVMSWLASMPAPTINPPDTRGLSGAWRSPAEWAVLASRAGLRAAPVVFDSAAGGFDAAATGGLGGFPLGPGSAFLEDVIVVGDAVFGAVDLPPDIVTGCRRLAAASATPVIGIAFADDAGEPVMNGVTPLPDLRAGGDGIVDAVANALMGAGVGSAR